MGGGLGDDALVGAGGAHLVELAPVYLHHRRAGLPGQGGQARQGAVGLSGGHKHLVQGAAAFDGLGDGVSSLEIILRRCVFSLPAGRSFLIHWLLSIPGRRVRPVLTTYQVIV